MMNINQQSGQLRWQLPVSASGIWTLCAAETRTHIPAAHRVPSWVQKSAVALLT